MFAGSPFHAPSINVQRPQQRAVLTQTTVDAVPVASVPGLCELQGWQNLALIAWFAPLTVEHVVPIEQMFRRFGEQHPGGFSTIHIVAGELQLPSLEMRTMLAHMTNEHASRLAASVVLIGTGGFWASALRGVVTALRVLVPQRLELRVCASIDEVVQWLPAVHEKRTGVKLETAELSRILQRIQAGMAPPSG